MCFSRSIYLIIVVVIIIIGCVRNGENKKHREGLEIKIFKIYYDIAWKCQTSLSYPHVHEVYTMTPPMFLLFFPLYISLLWLLL